MDLNKCIFVGRMTSDPKLIEDPEDPTQTKCTFTLAVNRRFKKGKADYPRFVVWGEKKAKAVMKFCQVGKEVAVEAKYQTEWYPAENAWSKGVNFQIFRVDEIVFGMDSQKVQREKEAARKEEMNRTVELPLPISEEWFPYANTSYNTEEDFLNQWMKERNERDG